jgi:hypothetical protein
VAVDLVHVAHARPDGVRRAGSPRQVAGGPITEDIRECQLKPFRRRWRLASGS